jgi:tetratricopeptide (TPR) repeat protein
MLGTSLHFLGDQRGAQVHLEQMVAHYDKDVHYVKSVGARIDHAYASRITLARVLWLQGLFDQAEALNARNVAEIEDAAYPLLACYALLDTAIPLALMRGQWELARQHGRELDKRLATIRLPIWEVCAACFAEMAAIGSGEGLLHLPLLANKLERMRQRHYLTHLSMIQGFMAEQLGAHERPLEGLGVIEEALAASEQREDRWCLPELGRVHGELLLKCAGPHAAEQAEQSFRRAMELANDQGALFWSLRTATSLGRLLHEQGRSSAASDLLGGVLGRFTQGFDTAEYRAARSLLAGWR